MQETVNRNPRSILGREAKTTPNNYQNKVNPSGEHRFKAAKDAMVCCLCPPPDDQFKSLHKLDCVLGECPSCPGYDHPPEEIEMENDILFHMIHSRHVPFTTCYQNILLPWRELD
jgi:hypothetical protein